MLHHNLTIAFRNLMKYKLQTSISILSLTVGMVCFALSALWLRYETSYDTWWPEHDDVYLVQYGDPSGYYMERGFSNYLSYPDAGRLAEAHPQIELLSRIFCHSFPSSDGTRLRSDRRWTLLFVLHPTFPFIILSACRTLRRWSFSSSSVRWT